MNENEEKKLSENDIEQKPIEEKSSTDNNVEKEPVEENNSSDNNNTDKQTEEKENNSFEEGEKTKPAEEAKSEIPLETAAASPNKGSGSDTSKIILIIVIALLAFAAVGGVIVYKVLMPMYSTKSKAEEKIEEVGNTAEDIINQASDIISDGAKTIEIEQYNMDLEDYVGTQNGAEVQELLDEVIMKLKKDTSRIVTVSYNGNSTFDTTELTNLKRQFDSTKNYEVSMNYDAEGYINEIKIEDI